MRLSQTLDMDGANVTCTHCGYVLCATDINWKETAILNETPMQSLGDPYSTGNEVLLRSFSCPGCGVLLDTETAMKGDPFLYDKIFM